MVGIDAELLLTSRGFYDLQIDDVGDIKSSDTFDTAIVVSLFTDRRADASEILQPENRRGWIGDESTPGIEIGSKLWLYNQSRLTQTTLNGMIDAARSALRWFVTEGLLESLTSAGSIVDSDEIQLLVSLKRFNSEVEPKLFTLWNTTGIRSFSDDS
jgi:phage gp46-like protein